MKRLVRVLGSLLAMVLTLVSLQSMAETQLGGRDFNHMSTGFPLSGGHATAACETCHMGGVFKGTPKNCDGCHALGKRVIATPKSITHIVTDAPCENCHFNTSTFLGARYNHSSATPGQCITCHNGRIAQTKPANHKPTTSSCDSCHRAIAWSPASWNHSGVVHGTCTNCHNGSPTIGKPGSHTTVAKATYQCDECHSFLGWIPAGYKHNIAGVCSNCHNGTTAMGKGSMHIVTTSACDTCHKSTTTWLGASAHSGNIVGICGTCHNGTTAKGKGSNHIATTSACDTCHKSTTSWLGASFHDASVASICGTCHNGTQGVVGKPALHIPSTGNNCDLCHTSTSSFATWIMNHSGITTCNACHATSSPAYPGINTRKTIGSHKSSRAGQDCVNCHNKGISWNE